MHVLLLQLQVTGMLLHTITQDREDSMNHNTQICKVTHFHFISHFIAASFSIRINAVNWALIKKIK